MGVLCEIASNDDSKRVTDTMKTKRSRLNRQRDPGKGEAFWSQDRINQSTPAMIKMIVPPKILEKDQEACVQILQKLVADKEADEMEKTWHQMNREGLRRKMMERHELNLEKEAKAGIKKEFKNVHERTARLLGSQTGTFEEDVVITPEMV